MYSPIAIVLAPFNQDVKKGFSRQDGRSFFFILKRYVLAVIFVRRSTGLHLYGSMSANQDSVNETVSVRAWIHAAQIADDLGLDSTKPDHAR